MTFGSTAGTMRGARFSSIGAGRAPTRARRGASNTRVFEVQGAGLDREDPDLILQMGWCLDKTMSCNFVIPLGTAIEDLFNNPNKEQIEESRDVDVDEDENTNTSYDDSELLGSVYSMGSSLGMATSKSGDLLETTVENLQLVEKPDLTSADSLAELLRQDPSEAPMISFDRTRTAQSSRWKRSNASQTPSMKSKSVPMTRVTSTSTSKILSQETMTSECQLISSTRSKDDTSQSNAALTKEELQEKKVEETATKVASFGDWSDWRQLLSIPAISSLRSLSVDHLESRDDPIKEILAEDVREGQSSEQEPELCECITNLYQLPSVKSSSTMTLENEETDKECFHLKDICRYSSRIDVDEFCFSPALMMNGTLTKTEEKIDREPIVVATNHTSVVEAPLDDQTNVSKAQEASDDRLQDKAPSTAESGTASRQGQAEIVGEELSSTKKTHKTGGILPKFMRNVFPGAVMSATDDESVLDPAVEVSLDDPANLSRATSQQTTVLAKGTTVNPVDEACLSDIAPSPSELETDKASKQGKGDVVGEGSSIAKDTDTNKEVFLPNLLKMLSFETVVSATNDASVVDSAVEVSLDSPANQSETTSQHQAVLAKGTTVNPGEDACVRDEASSPSELDKDSASKQAQTETIRKESSIAKNTNTAAGSRPKKLTAVGQRKAALAKRTSVAPGDDARLSAKAQSPSEPYTRKASKPGQAEVVSEESSAKDTNKTAEGILPKLMKRVLLGAVVSATNDASVVDPAVEISLDDPANPPRTTSQQNAAPSSTGLDTNRALKQGQIEAVDEESSIAKGTITTTEGNLPRLMKRVLRRPVVHATNDTSVEDPAVEVSLNHPSGNDCSLSQRGEGSTRSRSTLASKCESQKEWNSDPSDFSPTNLFLRNPKSLSVQQDSLRVLCCMLSSGSIHLKNKNEKYFDGWFSPRKGRC